MKLYYSAGSCSSSCHISLEEAGLKYELIEVDWDNASDPSVALIRKLNPLGTLPILITDDGKQIDQNIAIHLYIAEKAPQKNLLPAAGSFEHIQAVNWLSFIAADLHKSVGGMFGIPHMSPDKSFQETARKFMLVRANETIGYLNDKLAGKDYIMGKNFTVADSYAYVVLSWTKYLEIPLSPYKNVQDYMARVEARPAVAKVLKEEGLT